VEPNALRHLWLDDFPFSGFVFIPELGVEQFIVIVGWSLSLGCCWVALQLSVASVGVNEQKLLR